MGDVERLRELHDTYVWEVNAAVGEDRMDLVWQLADDYLDQALRILTTTEPAVCDRTDCPACAATRRAAHSRVRRRGLRPESWRRR